jgi:hypothetical protein
MTDTEAFLGVVKGPITFQTFDDDARRKAPHLSRVLQSDRELKKLNEQGAGIFFMVNEGDGKGRENANVVKVRSVFADFDGTPLPETWPLEPSAIIESSPGKYHAYWFTSNFPLDNLLFNAQQEAIATKLGAKPHDVKGISRVLRVPGYFHKKGEPFLVRVVLLNAERVYTVAQIQAVFPLPKPKPMRAYKAETVKDGELPSAEKVMEVMLQNADLNQGRNKLGFDIACQIRDNGHDKAECERVMVPEYVDLVYQGGDHPYTERELRSSITSAYKRPPREGWAAQVRTQSATILIATRDEDNETIEVETGLEVDEKRYVIGASGVRPVKLRKVEGEWEHLSDEQNPIAGRPIWPEAIGKDVTRGGQTYAKVSWFGPKGQKRSRWIPHSKINERSTLMDLDGAPVSYGRFARLTDWLSDAMGYVRNEEAELISRPFWVGDEFVQPGHHIYEYVGPEIPAKGTVAGWAEGLNELLRLGEAGYPGLVAVGFSAISPIVQKIDKRRPIILYSHPSSSGKGTVINFATSIWDFYKNRMLAAGSTWRGIQDKAITVPDYPIFVDEAQQLLKKNPNILEDLLYFFGNGQKRSVSSPEQEVRGGDPRHGVSFFAAETPVLDGREGGSQNRVIQIRVHPLPPDSPKLAARLERITRNHYGIVGRYIGGLLTDFTAEHVAKIEATASGIAQTTPALRGDDALNVALVNYGLKLVSLITGTELPRAEVMRWLAGQISEQREATIDRQTACLEAVIQTIYAQAWVERLAGGVETTVDYLKVFGEYVAFRGSEATAGYKLEINPNAKLVQQVTARYGFANPGPEWATRGWIEKTTDRNIAWQKRHKGERVGRVWRFTDKALKVAGADDDTD